jgi:hypothetical protein
MKEPWYEKLRQQLQQWFDCCDADLWDIQEDDLHTEHPPENQTHTAVHPLEE